MTDALTQAGRALLGARLADRLPARWTTRFAPAPTGLLHLGHVVNAVFVWSIARAFGGEILLRIEDHDRQRSRDAFDTAIRADLEWLGLEADNARLGWPSTLRQQPDALPYEDALATLEAQGNAYPCRCSRREIASVTPSGQDEEVRYPGTCRRSEVPPSETPARRVQLDDVSMEFDDLRHGAQRQTPSAQCGDVLVRDRRGHWTYQFAVTVDDLRQGVDVIIRGDDLLASTGRQLLIAAMLGRPALPLILHHPLVTHADGSKLSKSLGDSGIAELRAAGWTAPRLLGHAAWLAGLQPEPVALTVVELPSFWPESRQAPVPRGEGSTFPV